MTIHKAWELFDRLKQCDCVRSVECWCDCFRIDYSWNGYNCLLSIDCECNACINSRSMKPYVEDEALYSGRIQSSRKISEESNIQYSCHSCLADCLLVRYHNQTHADYYLCSVCFNDGKFEVGMFSSHFMLIESAEVLEELFVDTLFKKNESVNNACKMFDKLQDRYVDRSSLDSSFDGGNTQFDYVEDEFPVEFSMKFNKELDINEKDHSIVIKESITLLPIEIILPISLTKNALLPSLFQMYDPVVARGHAQEVQPYVRNKSEFSCVLTENEIIICVWDPGIYLNTVKLKGHSSEVRRLLWESTNMLLLFGSYDYMTNAWDSILQRMFEFVRHVDSFCVVSTCSACIPADDSRSNLSLHTTELKMKKYILLLVPLLMFLLEGQNRRLSLGLSDVFTEGDTIIFSIQIRWSTGRCKMLKAFQRRGFLAAIVKRLKHNLTAYNVPMSWLDDISISDEADDLGYNCPTSELRQGCWCYFGMQYGFIDWYVFTLSYTQVVNEPWLIFFGGRQDSGTKLYVLNLLSYPLARKLQRLHLELQRRIMIQVSLLSAQKMETEISYPSFFGGIILTADAKWSEGANTFPNLPKVWDPGVACELFLQSGEEHKLTSAHGSVCLSRSTEEMQISVYFASLFYVCKLSNLAAATPSTHGRFHHFPFDLGNTLFMLTLEYQFMYAQLGKAISPAGLSFSQIPFDPGGANSTLNIRMAKDLLEVTINKEENYFFCKNFVYLWEPTSSATSSGIAHTSLGNIASFEDIQCILTKSLSRVSGLISGNIDTRDNNLRKYAPVLKVRRVPTECNHPVLSVDVQSHTLSCITKMVSALSSQIKKFSGADGVAVGKEDSKRLIINEENGLKSSIFFCLYSDVSARVFKRKCNEGIRSWVVEQNIITLVTILVTNQMHSYSGPVDIVDVKLQGGTFTKTPWCAWVGKIRNILKRTNTVVRI